MNKPDTGAATDDPPAEVLDPPTKPAGKPDTSGEDDEEETKEPKKSDGPEANTPRWNEVYGKWKATERKLVEREQDFDALRQHNRALEERLNNVELSKADKAAEPEPDPEVDPAGYKKWVEFQRAKDKREFDKQREVDRHLTQVEIQKGLHEDYMEMIKVAERDMARDKALSDKVWKSENPAKAAYDYARKKTKEADDEDQETSRREKAKQQTDTEAAGEGDSGQSDEDEKLSEAETRVVRNLFPEMKLEDAKKKYLKQKKAIGRA